MFRGRLWQSWQGSLRSIVCLTCLLLCAMSGYTAEGGATPKIRVEVSRYNIHEAVDLLARKYGFNCSVESYAKPRRIVSQMNRIRRPLVIQGQSLLDAFDQICKVFNYEWSEVNGVYIFKNRDWIADAAYRVPREALEFAKKYGSDTSFRFVAHFLNLTPNQIESLAEQYPQLHALENDSLRRAEVETYVLLPLPIRERLDKGQKIKWSEIPANVQNKVMDLVRRKVRNVTREQMATTLHYLEKNRWGEEMWTFSGSFSAN